MTSLIPVIFPVQTKPRYQAKFHPNGNLASEETRTETSTRRVEGSADGGIFHERVVEKRPDGIVVTTDGLLDTQAQYAEVSGNAKIPKQRGYTVRSFADSIQNEAQPDNLAEALKAFADKRWPASTKAAKVPSHYLITGENRLGSAVLAAIRFLT